MNRNRHDRNVSRKTQMEDAFRFWSEIHMWDPSIYRIILIWALVLTTCSRRMWNGFIQLRTESNGRILLSQWWSLEFNKGMEFNGHLSKCQTLKNSTAWSDVFHFEFPPVVSSSCDSNAGWQLWFDSHQRHKFPRKYFEISAVAQLRYGAMSMGRQKPTF